PDRQQVAVPVDAVRPRWLNYRFGLVTGPLVDRVHRDGHLLSVWTPDTRRSMRRLMELGVDSITTNRVDTLCALRRQPTHGGTGAESSPPSRTRP
ncbi:glycerophosphodiester phosphodiesterase, partial [Streptomyces scabiei]|uniref:glycerophosphodiester phosphodiesterase n=2 Tax=Streptomyces scabiei TaxID=1930 RepID=UPI0029A58663